MLFGHSGVFPTPAAGKPTGGTMMEHMHHKFIIRKVSTRLPMCESSPYLAHVRNVEERRACASLYDRLLQREVRVLDWQRPPYNSTQEENDGLRKTELFGT